MEEKIEKIGKVLVDSGLLMIIDPCYVIDRGWSKDIKYSGDGTTLIHCKKYLSICKKARPHTEVDGGLVTSTYIGDGEYPVYLKTDKNGDPIEIIISLEQWKP